MVHKIIGFLYISTIQLGNIKDKQNFMQNSNIKSIKYLETNLTRNVQKLHERVYTNEDTCHVSQWDYSILKMSILTSYSKFNAILN